MAFVTLRAWHRLWGKGEGPQEIAVPSLPAAAEHFPQVTRVQLGHLTWIVIEYEAWKQIVLQKQQENES